MICKITQKLYIHIKEKHEASEDFGAHYSLSEMLYGRAKVTPDGTVCLWLGANVMVEYGEEIKLQAPFNSGSLGVCVRCGSLYAVDCISWRSCPSLSLIR